MKKTILVVDDLSSIRMLVSGTLNMNGYQTVSAANISEAWNILVTNPDIDLVLSDFNMPDGTGFDLLKKIKSADATERLPVIFLTATVSEEKSREAMHAGLYAWVKKPYMLHEFLAVIARALNLKSVLVYA